MFYHVYTPAYACEYAYYLLISLIRLKMMKKLSSALSFYEKNTYEKNID